MRSGDRKDYMKKQGGGDNLIVSMKILSIDTIYR